jgi:hypothetical protein
MMLDVLFGRFRSVMRGMVQVTLRGVRVVGRHFVISGFVMRRRFAMVPSRVFVMFCRFVMMLCRLLGHKSSSSICSIELEWAGRAGRSVHPITLTRCQGKVNAARRGFSKTRKTQERQSMLRYPAGSVALGRQP